MMIRYIEVLMVDDDKDNFDALKNKAAEKNIRLKYCSNLEDMVVELETNPKIDGVILDGKGYKRRDQVKGSEKEDFVHEALTELRILEKKLDRIFPKCVYTAWYDQLKDGLESRVRVFDKKKLSLESKLMDELFQFLHTEVAFTFTKKIRTKYAESLTGIGTKYIPADKEPLVIQILSKVESNDEIKKNDFNSVRDLLESVFIRANLIDSDFIPNDMIKNDGRPNLEWCYRYLCGLSVDIREPGSETVRKTYPKRNAIVPVHIGRTIDYVKQVSSIFSHPYSENWTSLSFRSASLALMEIIVWFKNYIDLKYPNI